MSSYLISLFFTDNYLVLFTSTIFGYYAYYLEDYKYYKVSNWVHYSSICAGTVMGLEHFYPGCFFLGFHLAHEFHNRIENL